MYPTVPLTVVQMNNTNGIKTYSHCQGNLIFFSWASQNTSLPNAAFLSQVVNGYITTPHSVSSHPVALAAEKYY